METVFSGVAVLGRMQWVARCAEHGQADCCIQSIQHSWAEKYLSWRFTMASPHEAMIPEVLSGKTTDERMKALEERQNSAPDPEFYEGISFPAGSEYSLCLICGYLADVVPADEHRAPAKYCPECQALHDTDLI